MGTEYQHKTVCYLVMSVANSNDALVAKITDDDSYDLAEWQGTEDFQSFRGMTRSFSQMNIFIFETGYNTTLMKNPPMLLLLLLKNIFLKF